MLKTLSKSCNDICNNGFIITNGTFTIKTLSSTVTTHTTQDFEKKSISTAKMLSSSFCNTHAYIIFQLFTLNYGIPSSFF